jgi:hypothetical protein
MPYALATHPAFPDAVYAGLKNGEVWASGDRGETWTRLALDLGSIWTMVPLPA